MAGEQQEGREAYWRKKDKWRDGKGVCKTDGHSGEARRMGRRHGGRSREAGSHFGPVDNTKLLLPWLWLSECFLGLEPSDAWC